MSCLADSAQNKLAFSSTSLTDPFSPIKGHHTTKHQGVNPKYVVPRLFFLKKMCRQFSDHLCFQTKRDERSVWWTVDLLEHFQIKAVNLTFASDQPIPKRYEYCVVS